jgi:uncharacterized damage-inducible protein DinB
MNPLLRDLLDHQIWADAEHWAAIGAHAAARDDKAIRDRLHHIHLVQRAFVWIVGDRAKQFVASKLEEFGMFDALREFARGSHQHVIACRDATSDEQLCEQVVIPWFKEPPLTLTRTEALTQMAMHSQWHRAQNATRLRELGGEPPMSDLIVWYWKGRPSATL